jgi:hypothetical protein
MASIGQVAVIVAQSGVDVEASACVDSLRREVSGIVVLRQEPGEAMQALGQRVRARLAQLTGQGYRLHSAAFLAQKGFGLGDVLGTADVVRVLLSGMLTTGHGQVVLQPAAQDLHAQVALKALADALSDQVRGTGVEIISLSVDRPSVRPLAEAVA